MSRPLRAPAVINSLDFDGAGRMLERMVLSLNASGRVQYTSRTAIVMRGRAQPSARGISADLGSVA